MPEGLIVFFRAFIAFSSMLIYTRLLGKQHVSQLSFFDYILAITIGSMAATLTTDLSSRAIAHWVGLTTWVFFALLLQYLTTKVRWWSKVIDGEPTVVVHNGKILEDNMAKMRYRYSDLMTQLREKNVFNLADVEFAILEPDGQLSVQKKSQHEPLTPADLNLPTSYKGVATELVVDGVILQQNLKQVGLTEEWLRNELSRRGINDLKEVTLASLYTDGTLYVDVRKDQLQHPVNISDYEGPN